MNNCIICHKNFKGFGNNPFPYKTQYGVCCDECNTKYVIPARAADIHKLIHMNAQIRPYA